MTRGAKPLTLAIGAISATLCLAACGATSSTSSSSSSFTGEKKQVAEAISSFQSDATSLEASKICSELLAKPVKSRLESKGGSCEKSIKTQLEGVDTFSVTVEEISLSGEKATAKVKSTVCGKEAPGAISFEKEKGSWMISDLSAGQSAGNECQSS